MTAYQEKRCSPHRNVRKT